MQIHTPMGPNNFGSKLKDYIRRRKSGVAGPGAIRAVGLTPADLTKIKTMDKNSRKR